MVYGVMAMILLEMLKFLVMIILHHLIMVIKKESLMLGEGPTDGINDRIGAAEKN